MRHNGRKYKVVKGGGCTECAALPASELCMELPGCAVTDHRWQEVQPGWSPWVAVWLCVAAVLIMGLVFIRGPL